MFTIGCHLSASKGFKNMGETALSIGANTFAFFTRNPRGGAAKAIDEADVQALIELMHEHNFGKLVAHAPYTVNPCSESQKTRDFAHMVLSEDIKRMEYLPGNYYNFHPGSHLNQGAEKGIELISAMLNDIITPEQSTIVLLETMAGKGSEVGRTFEELKAIIDNMKYPQKVGVCMDSCHVSDGGYDIAKDLEGVLAEFDRIIGIASLTQLDWEARRCRLDHVLLEPRWRGVQLGRRAVSELCRVAEEQYGFRSLGLTVLSENARAIACFLRCGFTEALRQSAPGGDAPRTRILMLRNAKGEDAWS